jgi:putative copper resistance protein D
MHPEAFNLHNLLTQWNFGPFSIAVLLVLIGVAEWYQHSVWKLRLRGRQWAPGRKVSFMFGLLAVDLAFQSPVANLAMSYFQAHIVQHLILMVAAPPLLALGAPSTLLLQTARRSTKTRWLHVLSSRPFAVLTNPVLVAFLYQGVMFVFFLTPLLKVAMMHMDLMDFMNAMFLFGGTLFWWPMVGLDPIMHWRMSHGIRMLNILLGTGLEAFLGIALLSDSHPAAPMYSLASTHAGGALVWVSTELVTLGAFLPIYIQWRRADAREAGRVDARLDRAFASEFAKVTATPDGDSIEVSGMTDVTDVTDVADVEATALSLWESEWLRRTGSVPTRRSSSSTELIRRLNAPNS